MDKLEEKTTPKKSNNKFLEEASFVKERIEEMQAFRKEIGIEDIWKRADEAMKIEPIGKLNNQKYAKDYSQRKVSLGTDNWQSDNADLTTFQKVHIALSVLAEQNPRATFKNTKRGLSPISLFHNHLYDWSLTKELFKFKLPRFIYNQGKYGVAFACTKAKTASRTVRDLVSIKENEKGSEEKYSDAETEDFKGVWFKVLNNWHVFWDDGAQVYDPWSMNDWCYYDYFTKKQIQRQFPDFEVTEMSEETPSDQEGAQVKRKGLYKVFFYENYAEDLMVVYSNEKVLDAFPLPNEHHRLSLNYAPWLLRDDTRIDGIGIPEILAQDKNLLEKVSNMSVDQLLLSIYKSFFHDGTNSEDGVLKIRPGVGQQLLDPSKMRWLEVPSGGKEAYDKQQMLRDQMDANTFSKTLGGESPAGRTAYELEQIKNSSIRRLKSPLDGLKFALTTDAHNRIDILHSIVTDVEVTEILDPIEAKAALAVYKDFPEMLKKDVEKGVIYKYEYPEVPMKLKKDGKDYVADKEVRFFPLTPEGVRFEGDVEIDVQSVLLPTPELEKQQLMELSNLIVPLFAGDPALNKKPAIQLCEKFDQDPKEWLPDAWLQETVAPNAEIPPENPNGVDASTLPPEALPPSTPQDQPIQTSTPPIPIPEPQKIVPDSELGGGKRGLVGKLAAMFGNTRK